MSLVINLADPNDRAAGLEAAANAMRRHDLVVLPTDTVYGIGTDAFSVAGVAALLEAKGRGRNLPVPVLVGYPRTVDGLVRGLPESGRDLIEAFWPGGLTIVAKAQPTLQWDLGDTSGTVAVRMPLHPAAIELLRAVGPMAVSSANKTGQAPAATIDEAVSQFGDAVRVYLDGGPSSATEPSTIVDVTGDVPRVLRIGALSLAELQTVVPELLGPESG
jgi:L-threonylcarbamoyladenylate synthase